MGSITGICNIITATKICQYLLTTFCILFFYISQKITNEIIKKQGLAFLGIITYYTYTPIKNFWYQVAKRLQRRKTSLLKVNCNTR